MKLFFNILKYSYKTQYLSNVTIYIAVLKFKKIYIYTKNNCLKLIY